MTTMNIQLKFHEPFRMGRWLPAKERTSENPDFVRARSFARCHKDRKTDKIRPFITGTLLRSALLRAVAHELLLTDGKWHDHDCCSAALTHENFFKQPLWTGGKKKPCVAGDRNRSCLLCLLAGRFDKAGKGAGRHGEYDVGFSNLNVAGSPLWESPQDIGILRTLNRVDDHTGKALDYFKVYEIDGINEFYGKIKLAESLPRKKEIQSLLEHCLGFVATMCGALCSVSTFSGTATVVSTEPSTNDVFPLPVSVTRSMAGAVLDLRKKDPKQFSLPLGHVDRSGHRTKHYIWDVKCTGNRPTLRKELEHMAEIRQDNLVAFRRAIENYAQQLFEKVKEEKSKTPVINLQSFRKETIHVGNQQKRRGDLRVTDEKEWIITGELRAATPFIFGSDADENDQISQQAFLTRDFYYRLPRSLQRGILRRDLRYASDNREGCNAEIGRGRKCPCPVCQVMHHLTLLDTKSHYRPAPDICHRIRKSATHGIANDGSLFDVEYGPEGSTFPFVLRYYGSKLPDSLKTVLAWWQQGYLFLGAHAGTGKGRFTLNKLQFFAWDLSDPKFRQAYAFYCGLREFGIEIKEDKESGLTQENIDLGSGDHIYPWRKYTWTFEFTGPVLAADTISALTDDEADAVFSRKSVVDAKGKVKEKPVLRGEGLRGLVRTAVARATGEDLLNDDHEDCQCILCRLFGNEHHAGVIRFEDMAPVGEAVDKRLDHLAIDRTDHSVKEKFDDRPLVGSPENPLAFKGDCWLHEEINSADFGFLRNGLRDIISGMYHVGSRGSIGYGHLSKITIPKELQLTDPAASDEIIEDFTPDDNSENLKKIFFEPETNGIYNPYYFIAPGESDPDRTSTPVSHATLQPDKLTGRLLCTLKTVSPLVLPDTSEIKNQAGCEQEHQEYKAFRLNSSLMIPGSQLRGAVSQVFETLTNSCFRIMDQKRILSWRMETGDYTGTKANDYQDAFLPGRVINHGRQVKRARSLRLPLYDQDPADYSDELKQALEQMRKQTLKENIKRITATPWQDAYTKNDWPQKLEKCEKILDRQLNSNEKETILESGLEKLKNQQLLEAFIADEKKHMDKVLNVNLKLANAAAANKKFLKELQSNEPEKWQAVMAGREPIVFTTENLANGDDENFEIVLLGQQVGKNRIKRQGYMKITGPNNPNDTRVDAVDNNYDTAWENPLDFTFTLNGPPESRPNTQNTRNFPRPGFLCTKDGKQITLSKRCERLFEVERQFSTFAIPRRVHEGYAGLLDEYRKNAKKIPPAFQTRNINGSKKLQEGDLVYFRADEKGTKAMDLAPVCISRIADDRFLGSRLREAFRPCAHVCLEECETCRADSCPIPLYREGYPNKGLCPACHLFGSQMYKGRVRFSFAEPLNENIDTATITLPLQERPRLSWVLDKKVRGKDDKEIPGRKQYLRYGGWQRIVEKKQDPTTGKDIIKGKNNASFESIPPGQKFKFIVNFENLTREEFGQLLYSLGLEKGMAHAMGRGKNFGFGQFEISAYRVDLRRGPNKWHKTNLESVPLDLPIVRNGLSALVKGSTEVKWHDLEHIQALRFMLTRHDKVTAFYPPLEGTSRIIGYKELKQDIKYVPGVALVVHPKNDTPIKPWGYIKPDTK